MNEQVVEVKPESKTVVVTSENSAEFYEKKMAVPEEPKVEEVKPEVKEEKVEVKEEEVDKKSAKYRFSQITQQKKDAETRAQQAEEKALAAEKKAQELELKLNPPKETGEPKPEDFQDIREFNKAHVKFTLDKEMQERTKADQEAKAKERSELVVKTWRERQSAFQKDTPDYEESLNNADVVVSNDVRDAILESDLGPQLLYHFSKHPEDAERISKLTVGGALRELGKIEAKLEKPKEEPKKEATAEISHAPEPITPINGGKGAAEVPINGKGEFTGTPKQWRDLRRAGKIH